MSKWFFFYFSRCLAQLRATKRVRVVVVTSKQLRCALAVCLAAARCLVCAGGGKY